MKTTILFFVVCTLVTPHTSCDRLGGVRYGSIDEYWRAMEKEIVTLPPWVGNELRRLANQSATMSVAGFQRPVAWGTLQRDHELLWFVWSNEDGRVFAQVQKPFYPGWSEHDPKRLIDPDNTGRYLRAQRYCNRTFDKCDLEAVAMDAVRALNGLKVGQFVMGGFFLW